MKLKELFEIMDGDTYVRIEDVDTEQHIEADANNSLIQILGEGQVESIFTAGTLGIKISMKG